MGLAAAVVSVCLAPACTGAEPAADRSQLEPLHGSIDPDQLAAPAAVQIPPPEPASAAGQWRVSTVIDGRTLELYQGLERATAVLGGIRVPVDDECRAQEATDSLTFITGGGREVAVDPPTARQHRISDATIRTAAGDDVATVLLSLGLAEVDESGPPRPGYEDAESEARSAALGIWSDDCDES